MTNCIDRERLNKTSIDSFLTKVVELAVYIREQVFSEDDEKVVHGLSLLTCLSDFMVEKGIMSVETKPCGDPDCPYEHEKHEH